MEILKDLRFSSCSQAHSQDFTLGGTEAARVHFFSQKKLTPVLVVALKTWVLPAAGFIYLRPTKHLG